LNFIILSLPKIPSLFINDAQNSQAISEKELTNLQKVRLQTSLQTRAKNQLKEVLSEAARQQRIDLLTVSRNS